MALPEHYAFGDFVLERSQQRVLRRDGTLVGLSPRLFCALLLFIERAGELLDRDTLMLALWPGLVVEENNLSQVVSSLRRALGDEPQGSRYIQTVPRRGFRFVAAVSLELDGATLWASRTDGVISASPGVAARQGHIEAGGDGFVERRSAGAAMPVSNTGAAPKMHNLPQARTEFIGREAVLAQCHRLLLGVRLLTLTGIGGCGKTRLALELAEQQFASVADQVWFVDLAPLQTAAQIGAVLAVTLGVREASETALFGLLAAKLAQPRTLLVLDNCEHVIDAVAELTNALLDKCAGLKIVATSRESLGVAGEQFFPVPPLSLPAGSGLDAVQASEAVRLFIARAQHALPAFALTDQNAVAVGVICRRLDGIPLAIELAAARVRVLTLEDIAQRLDDRFRLLTGGHRSLARHQTLHATLQWSFDSLTAQEQQLLRQLAVFAGGCTLAAASQVAAVSDPGAHATLELLTHLHDKSLLLVDLDGAAQSRYQMLETVRHYAHQQLIDSGELDLVRERHLHHYLALAEQSLLQSQGPLEGAWMARLAVEQENLFAAHAMCEHAAGGAQAALRLVAALWRYWVASAQLARGYRLAQAALANAGEEVDAVWKCRALWAAGQMAFRMGHYGDSLAASGQALALARLIDDAEQIASALSLLACGLHATEQYAPALEAYEQACAVARTLKTRAALGSALNNLAELHRDRGDLASAETCYEESIVIAREQQYPGGIFVPLCNLARLSVITGKLERARVLLHESLELAVAAGLKGMNEDLLDVGAGLAAKRGEYPTTARFSGAAHTLMRESGTQRQPVDEAFVAPLIACARTALGAQAFAAAEAAGLALSHDAAIEEVRQWLARDVPMPQRPS